MLQVICPIHGSKNGVFTSQGMFCQACLNQKIENSLKETDGNDFGELKWENHDEQGSF